MSSFVKMCGLFPSFGPLSQLAELFSPPRNPSSFSPSGLLIFFSIHPLCFFESTMTSQWYRRLFSGEAAY